MLRASESSCGDVGVLMVLLQMLKYVFINTHPCTYTCR